MRPFVREQRFVLAVGEAAERVLEKSGVNILSRREGVVLGEGSRAAVLDLQDAPDVFIRVFEHEEDARRAFDLFAG